MSDAQNDPTEPLRSKAAAFPGAEAGTSCNQTSFKVGKKAFLYVGPQGGRYKAMFKLKDSLPEAAQLAEVHPDQYEVGKHGYVTTRFDEENPIPEDLWPKWLEESYTLAAPKKKVRK